MLISHISLRHCCWLGAGKNTWRRPPKSPGWYGSLLRFGLPKVFGLPQTPERLLVQVQVVSLLRPQKSSRGPTFGVLEPIDWMYDVNNTIQPVSLAHVLIKQLFLSWVFWFSSGTEGNDNSFVWHFFWISPKNPKHFDVFAFVSLFMFLWHFGFSGLRWTGWSWTLTTSAFRLGPRAFFRCLFPVLPLDSKIYVCIVWSYIHTDSTSTHCQWFNEFDCHVLLVGVVSWVMNSDVDLIHWARLSIAYF